VLGLALPDAAAIRFTYSALHRPADDLNDYLLSRHSRDESRLVGLPFAGNRYFPSFTLGLANAEEFRQLFVAVSENTPQIA
jgi:hypothetical protein